MVFLSFSKAGYEFCPDQEQDHKAYLASSITQDATPSLHSPIGPVLSLLPL